MLERHGEEWLERALEDERRAAAASPPPPGGFADVQSRRTRRRRQRRRDATVALASALAFLTALGAARWWLEASAVDSSTPGATGPVAAGPAPAGSSPALQTSGGTVTLVAEDDARVRELGDRVFAVDAGTVWFAVEPGSGRLEVRTPDRTIVVLGTVFAVRVDGTAAAARTTVGVLTGRVRIEAGDAGVVDLSAGQRLPPDAASALPLDAAWRARMTALFPERAAREALLAAPEAAPAADVKIAGSAAPRSTASPGVPPAASAATETVSSAPRPADPPGGGGTATTSGPAPRDGASAATTRPHAETSNAPPGETASAVPRSAPAAISGAPPDPQARPWSMAYQQAWGRLGRDPMATAAAIEALIDSAPTPAAAEDATIALASIYHDNLGHFARARTVYERYLERFPAGKYRRDVWMRLCLAYGETGEAERQRLCLAAFAVEFPEGR